MATIKEQVKKNLGMKFYGPEDALYLFETNCDKIIDEALRLHDKRILEEVTKSNIKKKRTSTLYGTFLCIMRKLRIQED